MTLPLRKKLRTTVQSIRSQAKALKRQAVRSALVASVLLTSTTSSVLAPSSHAQAPSTGNWQPNRLPPDPAMQPLNSQSNNAANNAGDSGVVLRWRTSTRLNGAQGASASRDTAQYAASPASSVSPSAAARALEPTNETQATRFNATNDQVVTASASANTNSASSSSNNAWSANPLRSSGAAQSMAARQPSSTSASVSNTRAAQHSVPRDGAVRTAAYQPPAGGLLPPAGSLGNGVQPPALPGGGLPQLPADPLGLPEAAPLPPANAGGAPVSPLGNLPQTMPTNPLAFPTQPDGLSFPPTAAEPAPVVPNQSVPNQNAPGQSWPGNAPSLPPAQSNELRSQTNDPTQPSRPDPFERRRPLDDLDSPSDRQSNRREADLQRKRPEDDATLNCESFRDRLRKSTLDKINLNSAPRYGSGLNPDSEESEKQRLSFAASAETRDWCDRLGQTLVQGRMVDLLNEQVVLDVNGQRREIPLRDLCDVDLAYVGKVWNLPISCGSGYEPVPGRDFVPSAMQWKASGLCHKPLYFEEVQLERYGHEVGPVLQPLISTAHFFGNVAVLPYKMGIHPPNECQYALGYYRPGDCAPYMIPPIPWSLRGALVEAGVVTGAAALIP